MYREMQAYVQAGVTDRNEEEIRRIKRRGKRNAGWQRGREGERHAEEGEGRVGPELPGEHPGHRPGPQPPPPAPRTQEHGGQPRQPCAPAPPHPAAPPPAPRCAPPAPALCSGRAASSPPPLLSSAPPPPPAPPRGCALRRRRLGARPAPQRSVALHGQRFLSGEMGSPRPPGEQGLPRNKNPAQRQARPGRAAGP